MAISTRRNILNIRPGSIPVIVHLSQGDVGNTIEFYMYDGSEPFYSDGYQASVHGIRQDGVGFGPYDVTIVAGENRVNFNVSEEMTAISGAGLAELIFTDSQGNSVGSANFALLVEKGTFPLSPIYSNDISVYQQILNYVQTIPASVRSDYIARIATVQNNLNAETVARQSADNTLQANINAEASIRATTDASLQSQIDQMIAPSGEAPSAAEVQNARIGSDGTVYSTLGDAIRDQNSLLKNQLGETINVVNPQQKNTYTIQTAGAFVTAGTFFLRKGHRYTFVVSRATAENIVIYNRLYVADTEVVSSFSLASGATSNTLLRVPTADEVIVWKTYCGSVGKVVSMTVTDEMSLEMEMMRDNYSAITMSMLKTKSNECYTFQRGTLVNGRIDALSYRVVSTDIIRFSEDITVKVSAGFKFGVQTYVNGAYATDSGWQYGSLDIPKNTYFRIGVARATENESEVANIDTFASALRFDTKLNQNIVSYVNGEDAVVQSQLKYLNQFLRYKLKTEWEQGGVSGTGSLSYGTKDIRTTLTKLDPGRYYIDPNGYKLYYCYYTSDGTYVNNAASYDKKWGAEDPFYLEINSTTYVIFSQHSETDILPSEHTLIVAVVSDNGLYYSRFANGVKFISKGGNGLGVPRESVLSVIEAWKNLYDIYRVDVCKTSDGYYVASHDRAINNYARNADGTTISSTINIDEHTLAELNQYDYGIVVGQRYAGQKITLVSDIIAVCAKLGMSVSVEWKFPAMIQADADALFAMMASNGFGNDQWRWNLANATQLAYVTNTCEYTDVVVVVGYTDIDYTYLESAINGKRRVIAGYTTQNLPIADIIALRKLNIVQGHSIAESIADIVSFIEAGVTYIETTITNPRKSLIDYALNLENYN